MEALVVILVCTVFALGVYELGMFLTDLVVATINWIHEYLLAASIRRDR
jgi:hypothetical protein